MEVEVSESEGILRITPAGRLSKEEGDQLLDELTKRSADGPRGLLLDLSRVDYMTSSAVGAVIAIFGRVASGGGRMAVAAPNERVGLLLEVAGLNQLLPICATLEEAERSLAKSEEGPAS